MVGKITDLSAAATLVGTELAEIVQSGANVKYTPAQMAAYVTLTQPKVNSTTTDPTINSDTSAGYSVGSRWINTATAWLFFCRDATNGAAVWMRADSPDHPGYVAAGWQPCAPGTVAAGSAFAGSVARFSPFMVKERITISDLGVMVTTISAAGNFQLAVYASDPTTKKPTGAALAYTLATLSTGTATQVTGALNANLQLEPGVLYYMAVSADNTAVVFSTLAPATVQQYLSTPNLSDYLAAGGQTYFNYSMAYAYSNLNTLTAVPASMSIVNGTAASKTAHVSFKVVSIP